MNKTKMNLDVKLLYVEEFENKLPTPAVHPKVGRVYRAIMRRHPDNEEVNYYQILYEDPETEELGMFVNALEIDNPYFKAKFKELTEKEIPHVELEKEDYLKLAEWGDNYTNNIDVDLLNVESVNNTPILDEDAIQAISDKVAKNILDFITRIRDNNPTAIIKQKDPAFYAALFELVNYLASTYRDKYEDMKTTNVSKELLMSKEYGKGANLFNVYKYLRRYQTGGYDKSDNPADLLKAVHYLLFELTRLKVHAEEKN